MEAANSTQEEDFLEPTYRHILHTIVCWALEYKSSIVEELRTDPMILSKGFARVTGTPERILQTLHHMRAETLKRIEEERRPFPGVGKIYTYLRKLEDESPREFIQFAARWAVNNLLAMNLTGRIDESPYTEKSYQLGARLYHLEDLIRAQEEIKNSSNTAKNSAILIADGPQTTQEAR